MLNKQDLLEAELENVYLFLDWHTKQIKKLKKEIKKLKKRR